MLTKACFLVMSLVFLIWQTKNRCLYKRAIPEVDKLLRKSRYISSDFWMLSMHTTVHGNNTWSKRCLCRRSIALRNRMQTRQCLARQTIVSRSEIQTRKCLSRQATNLDQADSDSGSVQTIGRNDTVASASCCGRLPTIEFEPRIYYFEKWQDDKVDFQCTPHLCFLTWQG